MASIIPTSLTRYELTSEELISGQALTHLNKCVLQNLVADYSELQLALNFNPDSPNEFIQTQAKYQGIIEILRSLIDTSDIATSSVSI